MQFLALAILVASSIWLIFIAILMAFRPALCLRLLGRMASSHRINLIEQGLRMTGGVALIVWGPQSKAPLLFEIGGWFIVATSILLIALPLKWHAAFANWFSHNLTPAMVQALSPVSAALGAALLYAAL